MAADSLLVGGLAPLTTVDFPQHLSAVVFCQGCPWRCPYCHNPHLLPRKAKATVPWPQVREFLDRRRGFLDAVVFSGGEPLMQAAVEDAIAEVGALGFRVALHTAGYDPDRLARLLPSVDWIGFDLKAPFEAYGRVTCIADSGITARTSLGHLLASGISYEVRTTADPDLLSRDDLRLMAAELAAMGVKNWVLQECRKPRNDGSFSPGPADPPLDDRDFLAVIGKPFPQFDVRRD